MKLTDYVVHFLLENGIDTVFGLTGGAVVHLFDSVDRNPDTKAIFCHHEQAAAFAAQAYARIRNHPGAAFVTTGPGGTNAITGLSAAWLDSVPCIYISGQARLAHTTHTKAIRQLGVQQMDILKLVAPITKYSVLIEDPAQIKYQLQKAFYMATHGRPGPVWIDLPMDLQWASIEPDSLPSFDPHELGSSHRSIQQQVRRCCELMASAQRPMILAGYGIPLGHAQEEFRLLVQDYELPFVTTYNACDMLPSDHKLNIGCPGMFGQRGANLAIQNCDLLLTIGSHLCIALTGTLFDAFAREAKIIMVDADETELAHRTVRVDLPINSDSKLFLQEFLKQLPAFARPDIRPWREKCAKYKARYNSTPRESYLQEEYVNPYVFMEELSNELSREDMIVVDGGGTVNQIAFQSFRVKEGQRLIISSGICSMGSGLPESIGCSVARKGSRAICLTGDGSLQLNIQEMQTLVHHNLPAKIFVLNNQGYLSIRNTQNGFLENNYVGSCAKGGMSLPDFLKLAQAYGLKTSRIENHGELTNILRQVLATEGPVLCEVAVAPFQQIAPQQAFEKNADGSFAPRPLEDMEPLLCREEFLEAMVVKPWKNSFSRIAEFEAAKLEL